MRVSFMTHDPFFYLNKVKYVDSSPSVFILQYKQILIKIECEKPYIYVVHAHDKHYIYVVHAHGS